MSTPANSPVSGQAIGRSGTPLMARVRHPSTGALVTVASVATVRYAVRDLTAGALVGSGSLTPSAVLYDALQTTDPRWAADSAAAPGPDGSYGYNLAWTVPATLLTWTPTADRVGSPLPHAFQVELVITPATGEPFVVPFRLTVYGTWGAA